MTKEAKRIGRPLKPPMKGKRVSLGLKVTAEVKRHIDKAAQDSGRTQSQEAEALIERALTHDAMLKAMNTTVEKIKKGNIEAALREAGYRPTHTSDGKAWVLDKDPKKRCGFIDPEGE
jgi:hypothetical protein